MSFKYLNEFEYLSIRFQKNNFQILDQRKLPDEENWTDVDSVDTMYHLIKHLAVRGAPLIGVCAAFSLAISAINGSSKESVIQQAIYLKSARPTAVNLGTCCDIIISELKQDVDSSNHNVQNIKKRKIEDHVEVVCEIAKSILSKEVEMNEKMSNFGNSLIKDGENILTHCNTGSLATPGLGTALGVIKKAHQSGKKIHVYVDETRPLLQGARLTTYELEREKIPYTLICDNMAGTLMKNGKIQRVLLGADRIAINGDFANKIGTYSVAVLAKFHNIPFHTVAPRSTIDFDCKTGNDIPIEERVAKEVQGVTTHNQTVRWSPINAHVFNPAFDVTPVELLTSIILDSGIFTVEDIKKGAFNSMKTFYE